MVCYISGVLALIAAEIYSRHLDCDRESVTTPVCNEHLGYCAYLTFIASVLGLAALFVSSLTLILTRDDGYQTLKESSVL